MPDGLRTADLTYSQDYWDSLDGGAGYQDSPMWEDLAFLVREMFCIDPDRGDVSGEHNLIDFGCAFGFLVRHLRRRGIDAWGADVSSYAVSQAPSDVSEFLRVVDITQGDPGFMAGYPFRLAVCLEVMEHIPENRVDHALGFIRNSLTAGGRALFAICTEDRHGWDSDPTHITMHSRDWWAQRLDRIGFVRDHEKEAWLTDFWAFKGHNGVFVVSRQ